jgi:hypothetical protein
MSLSALFFLVSFAGAALLCLVRSPIFGIILYEYQYFQNPPVRWWWGQIPDFRYALVVILVLVAGYLVRYQHFTSNRLRDIPQFRWLMGMTGIVLLAFFWCVDSGAHEKWTILYLKYLVFVFFFYKVVCTEKHLDLSLAFYLLGVFYWCWLGWQMGRTGDGRLEGIGGPDCAAVNGAAAVMATAVPMLLYVVLFISKKWVQFAGLVILTFVLNGLVLLNSRGSFLALLVSVAWFAYAVFREKGIGPVKWKLIAGMIGGILLFVYLADDLFWSRMSTLENVDPEEGSGHRMLYWMKTFEMLADHPFGVGAMGFQILSPAYMPAEWLSGGQRAVHSTWFEVLASYGFQGLVVFLGYIFSTFFLARKVKKYLREKEDQFHLLQLVALESAFLAFLVAASFIDRFHAEMLYWLPAFIAAFANIYMIKPQREEAAERLKSNH